jgi:hypothetical protein
MSQAKKATILTLGSLAVVLAVSAALWVVDAAAALRVGG